MRFSTTLLIGLLGCCLFAGAAVAGPGDLDRSFGQNGKILNPYPPDPAVPETSYAGDFAYVVDSAADSAGRIYTLEDRYRDLGLNAMYVTRFTADGSVDPSFGSNGTSRAPFTTPPDRYNLYPSAIALRGDRVIVAGQRDYEVAVAAFRISDGAPDPTFGGGDGVLTVPVFNDHPRSGAGDVAIDSEGRIVVTRKSSEDFEVARIRADGEGLDLTFSEDGVAEAVSGSFSYDDLAIDSQNRIVVAEADRGARQGFQAARFTEEGDLDPSFGEAGLSFVPLSDRRGVLLEPVSLEIDPEGRIVLAGDDFDVARLLDDGELDPALGGDGVVGVDFGPKHRTFEIGGFRESNFEAANDMVVDGSGRITLAGEDAFGHFALARFRADGTLDRSFGGNGRSMTDFGSTIDGRITGIHRSGAQLFAVGTTIRHVDGDTDSAANTFTRYGTDSQVSCLGRAVDIFGIGGGTLEGTTRTDTIMGNGARNEVLAGPGADRVCSRGGRDAVFGGSGRDRLFGGTGADRLFGRAGRDLLLGGAGPDRLVGGPRRDRLVGGPGRDRLRQ